MPTPEEIAAKEAADKAAADKAAADKAAADKAAADKVAADKAAADKKAADEAAAAEAARKARKAPDKYELKLPEGSLVHGDTVLELEKRARAANLSNDEAQALLSEHAAQVQAISDRYFEQAKADKDYGGDKLELSQKRANLVVNTIRPEGHPRRSAFLSFLRAGGANNHIEIVAFLADLGRRLEEDHGIVDGRPLQGGDKDTDPRARQAATLYPDKK